MPNIVNPVKGPNAVPGKTIPVALTTDGSGSIEGQFMSVGVYNNGAGDAIFDGQILPASVAVSYPPGNYDTVSFDGQGNELLIKAFYQL